MTDEERLREEFRGEVRRIESDVRRIDLARGQQELGFVTLKGDVQRIESMVRTGTTMSIEATFVALGNRLGTIEAGEKERLEAAKWMKRVLPFTLAALIASWLGVVLTLARVLKGG